MTEFMTTLHLRIHDAVAALKSARARGDEDLCLVQAGEIEDLVEIAARHGVDIDCGYGALAHAA
ncbi:hypothetical protein ACFPZ0_25915 [Streptomonospora nanhaiensis]|uniref:Uncharacterized protein n=1 Tax=Streptomonospora nanhaiensis TaxID=1323731 RepID=A0A853BTH1_9ACTN|nr:hypothetical protein [Streptomonospora nanhaiensis]MBV2363596.1 hypothetical protein [Streptomonospora nanhaiensis]MBX9391625.1 hypothetical protein [Streptomonospora nanhaiensis]NYI98638.1 hypothetical protein [Streptomonospora nanhaiensis]